MECDDYCTIPSCRYNIKGECTGSVVQKHYCRENGVLGVLWVKDTN